MTYFEHDDTRFHYQLTGEGKEVLVFAHGLLWSGEMFAPQVEHFQSRYRCLTYDFRGQGRSQITGNGYDMETLYLDTTALLDHLDIDRCHFIGQSMGGFIALRLAAREPNRIQSLTLMATSAGSEDSSKVKRYRLFNFIARWFGLWSVRNQVMDIMFGDTFLDDKSRKGLKKEWKKKLLANENSGITRATKGVLDREGVEGELEKITAPTLILVGEEDSATPVEKSEFLHRNIDDSRLEIIPRAGHTLTIEEPDAVNRALANFLKSVEVEVGE